MTVMLTYSYLACDMPLLVVGLKKKILWITELDQRWRNAYRE